MLTAVSQACTEAGVADRLHLERFGAADIVRTDADCASDNNDCDSAFEVVLQQSGVTVTVTADQSILDAVRAAGPDVDSSCEKAIAEAAKPGSCPDSLSIEEVS